MNPLKKNRIKRLLKILSSETTQTQQLDAMLALVSLDAPQAFELLIKKLSEGYANAAMALGALGDKRAIPILKTYLLNENKDLSLNCSKALGSLGETHWQTYIRGERDDFERLASSKDESAIELLIEASMQDQGEHNPAISALGHSDNPTVAKMVRERLNDNNGAAVSTWIEILGDLKDFRATQKLTKFLRSPVKSNKISAIIALGKIGDVRAIEPLLDVVNHELVQDLVIENLMKINARRAINSIIDKLVVLDGEERILVAGVLDKLGESKWRTMIQGDDKDLKRLGESGDQSFYIPMVNLLVSHTCQSNPELKCVVIEGLGSLKDPDCIELLKNALLDPSKPVRKAAAEALNKFGETLWAEWIKGEDQDFLNLCEATDPKALELLIRYLNTYKQDLPEDDYKKIAQRAFEKVHHSDALEIMLKALDPGNTDLIRIQAAKSLGRIGNQAAVEPLIKTLKDDKNEQIRIFAARALGEIGAPTSHEQLESTLIAPSGSLRKASAKALTSMGNPLWEKMIKGDDKDFSRLAANGNPRAVELLIAMIRTYSQSNHDLFKELDLARMALGEVRNPDSFDVLIEALADKKVQISAVTALGNIGDPRAVLDLIRLWNNLSGHGNSTLIQALAKIGDSQAVDGLIWRIEDDNRYDTIEIIEALGKFDVKLVIKPLFSTLSPLVLQDILIAPSGPLRHAIAQELSKKGDPFWEPMIQGDHDDFSRLGALGSPRAIKLLILMIRTYYQRKHTLKRDLKLARKALEKVNNPEAVNSLIGIINEDLLQTSAVTALGEIGNPQAVDPLLELWGRIPEGDISFEDANLKSLIINSLVKIGDESAIAGLMGRLVYNIEDDADRIINALGNTDNKLAIEALASLLRHSWSHIRKSAAKVLIKIASNEIRITGHHWKEILALIEIPHSDLLSDGHNCVGDYTHNDTRVHTDTGIGLIIPPELRNRLT